MPNGTTNDCEAQLIEVMDGFADEEELNELFEEIWEELNK